MINREKAIKGLEMHASGMCNVLTSNGKEYCPYWENNDNCTFALLEDARSLLKAQEPRVMTLEEVQSSVGNDMYLEISTRTDEMPYITAATLDGAGQKGVVFYCDHFNFVAYNRRLYGWRCWTSRPTCEQMEATPWAD